LSLVICKDSSAGRVLAEGRIVPNDSLDREIMLDCRNDRSVDGLDGRSDLPFYIGKTNLDSMRAAVHLCHCKHIPIDLRKNT
jgi:hypothetical protein